MTLLTARAARSVREPRTLAVASRRGEAGRVGRVRSTRLADAAADERQTSTTSSASRASRSRGTSNPHSSSCSTTGSHAGQPGYEVLTPFAARRAAERVLVNRGWVPFTGYRDRLPDISLRSDTVASHQRPHRRTAARRDSPAAARHRAPDASWPKLTSFPDARQNSQTALGEKLARRIVLLDPGLARRLRARVVATGPGTRAAFFIRHPMVGFCRRAARALLRPQFSQGVLMEESRRRGRRCC